MSAAWIVAVLVIALGALGTLATTRAVFLGYRISVATSVVRAELSNSPPRLTWGPMVLAAGQLVFAWATYAALCTYVLAYAMGVQGWTSGGGL